MIAVVWYGLFFAAFAAVARTQWPELDPRRPAFVLGALAGAVAAIFAGHGALLAFLSVAAITDVCTGHVFDAVAAAAAGALFACAMLHGTPWSGVAGAAAAGAPLLLLHAVTRGRGLGFGDVKLAAVIGLGVGPGTALPCIACAFVAGALWGVYALARGGARGQSVPFAPFLGIGTALSLWSAAWPIG